MVTLPHRAPSEVSPYEKDKPFLVFDEIGLPLPTIPSQYHNVGYVGKDDIPPRLREAVAASTNLSITQLYLNCGSF